LTSPRRDPRRDPVIDFLTSDDKTGHCEYFASALCLMLRSLEIPARVVMGYKGAEFNSVGNFYQVRQLNAHAWVEVFLTPEQLPSSLQLAGSSAVGGWLRLDPTPVDTDDAFSEGQTLMERIREYRDYVQLLWNDYILGLDSQRQRESVYEPMKRWAMAFLSPESWGYFLQNFRNEIANMVRQRQFGWRAGLGVLLFGAACVVGFRALRLVGARLLGQLRQSRGVGIPFSRQVEFYRRCEKLLKRYGHRRRKTQTPREFSRQVAMATSNDVAVTSAIERIVDDFYRVRFGGERLDAIQTRNVETLLAELESHLSLGTGMKTAFR
jgi:hypothetical protein